MAASILIVSGPPGAGKTTVARVLAETSTRPAVHLRFDDFLAAIRAGYVLPWLAESAEQNNTVTRACAAAAEAYAAGGYAVVLDGVIGPWFLDLYRAAAARAGAELAYAVLRPDRATAVIRARDRTDEPMADYPDGLFEKFADLGALEAHAIDTTGLGVGDVAERLRRGWQDGSFRVE